MEKMKEKSEKEAILLPHEKRMTVRMRQMEMRMKRGHTASNLNTDSSRSYYLFCDKRG